MNNSDLIAALSLAITAIIFIVQTDDGLLRLKTKRNERWIVAGILFLIILLINYEIFERFHITFYFTICGKYLKPAEWALIFFLFLLTLTLYRIFTPRIFNDDPATIFSLIRKYRAEKKWNKLQNLISRVVELSDFRERYGEELNDTIFNDHHLIEYFASDYPDLLIEFCVRYPEASIANGDHFFNILNGLFADKSNPIFSEIRHYHNDDEKKKFLEELQSLRYEGGFRYEPEKKYATQLPIISWLTDIIASKPSSLEEEIAYFFLQFPETASLKNNKDIFTKNEIERLLSRDKVFNVIKLFRIILVEYCLTEKMANILIDRVLLLLYSCWEHIGNSTRHESHGRVVLNNDNYTINEYFLKYLFYSYLSLYLLLHYMRPFRIKEDDEANDSSTWPMKQLFAKLDSLLGHERNISDRSKKYYAERLFQLYFEIPKYFSDDQKDTSEECSEHLLWYIKDSLEDSPYGNVQLIRKQFDTAFESFDFLEYNNRNTKQRSKHFYEYLLPYSKSYEWRIKNSTPG
ncbi:MAG: hypothetical protein ACXVC6_13525 [Bacteroidia bacterium]